MKNKSLAPRSGGTAGGMTRREALAWSIDQDVLTMYARMTCPVHGQRRFGGPNPDPEPIPVDESASIAYRNG